MSLLTLLLAAAPMLTPQEPATTDAVPSRTIAVQEGNILAFAHDAKAKTIFVSRAGFRDLTPPGAGEPFLIPNCKLQAYDLKEGRLKWSANASSHEPVLSISAGEDLVIYPMEAGMAFRSIDAQTGESVGGHGSTLRGSTTHVLCGPKDRWVWAGGPDGTMSRMTVKDIQSWSLRPMKNGGVECITLDPAGKTIAVGGKDGNIRFLGHSSANRDDKKIFKGDGGEITALAFDSKGKNLLAGNSNGGLRLHKMSSGKTSLDLNTGNAAIEAVAIHPKNKWVASAAKGSIKLHSSRKGELLMTLQMPSDQKVVGLLVLDKGKSLLAAGGQGVTIWDLSDI